MPYCIGDLVHIPKEDSYSIITSVFEPTKHEPMAIGMRIVCIGSSCDLAYQQSLFLQIGQSSTISADWLQQNSRIIG